jgi:hypothetical protein
MSLDGWTLLEDLQEQLNEPSSGTFLNDRVSYGYFYDAARQINSRLAIVTSTQSITTVADTYEYNLNPDFMGLYMRDSNGEYFVKYTDSGSSDYFVTHQPYDELYYNRTSTSGPIPYHFSVSNATAVSNVTGTASAAGTVSNGEATLTDTSSSTKFSTISAGDIVHNTTQDYHGIVIAKTSDTALVTAIFNSSGTGQSWTSSDASIIIPQGRFKLIIDPPSYTASETITVPYVQKPTPVFSYYRAYNFPESCHEAIIEYAAFKYKYRDRDHSFGDKFFAWFDKEVRTSGAVIRKAENRGGFKMSLKGVK